MATLTDAQGNPIGTSTSPLTVAPTGALLTQTLITLAAGVSQQLVPAGNYKALRWEVVGTNPMTVSVGTAAAVVGQGQQYAGASGAGLAGGSENFSGNEVPTNAFQAISSAGTTVIVWATLALSDAAVLGPLLGTFAVGASAGTVIASLTGFVAGETATSISPADGRVVLSGNALQVGSTAATAGPVPYTITTSAGRKLVIEVIVTPAVIVLPTLGPVTAAYSTGTTAGTVIAPLTGLTTGESAILITPNDGCVVLNNLENALLIGLAAATASTSIVNYQVTTNLGRTLNIAVSVTATAAVPAPPTLQVVSGNAQNSLYWTDGSNGGSIITSHKLYRSTAAGTETLLATITTASPYVDGGLTNGTTYFYRITAINSVGESLTSNEVSATPSTSVVAPPTSNGSGWNDTSSWDDTQTWNDAA